MDYPLIVLSGGQDSTTCLLWALEKYEQPPKAIIFNYGQKHLIEIKQAQLICWILNIEYEVLEIGKVFENSALVNHGMDINQAHPENPELPASFVPGRNALFLTIAFAHAFNHGYNKVITGVNETDYSGYPDCRSEFINSMERSLQLATDRYDIMIVTPLIDKSKAEIWKMANDLGKLEFIVEHTHTDYNGNRDERHDWGYGKLDNPASRIRKEGFEQAKEKGWI